MIIEEFLKRYANVPLGKREEVLFPLEPCSNPLTLTEAWRSIRHLRYEIRNNEDEIKMLIKKFETFL